MKAVIFFLILFYNAPTTICDGDCDDWTISDLRSKIKSEMWGALRCHSENTILDVDIDDIDFNGKRYEFEGTYEAKKEGARFSYPGKLTGEFILEDSFTGCKLNIRKARYSRALYSGSLMGCL